MISKKIFYSYLLSFSAMHVACLGCSESSTTVSGLVTLDGKPLEIREGMKGTVLFQPANRVGPTLSGMINSKGIYSVATGSATSVKPGVYTATVSAVEIVPANDKNPQPEGNRITPLKYADASESGLRVKIISGANSIALELFSEVSEDDEVETVSVDQDVPQGNTDPSIGEISQTNESSTTNETPQETEQ